MTHICDCIRARRIAGPLLALLFLIPSLSVEAGTGGSVKRARFAFERLVGLEAALEDAEAIVIRTRELATVAANDTYNAESRALIADEVEILFRSLLEIANRTDGKYPYFSSRRGKVVVASGEFVPGEPAPVVWFVGRKFEKRFRFGRSVKIPVTLSGAQIFFANDGKSSFPPLIEDDLFDVLGSLHDALRANDQTGTANILNRLACPTERQLFRRCTSMRRTLLPAFHSLNDRMPEAARPRCEELQIGMARLADAFATAAASSVPRAAVERAVVFELTLELINRIARLRASTYGWVARFDSSGLIDVVGATERIETRMALGAWTATLVHVVNEQHLLGADLEYAYAANYFRPIHALNAGWSLIYPLRVNCLIDPRCGGSHYAIALGSPPGPAQAGDVSNAQELAQLMWSPTRQHLPEDTIGEPTGPWRTLVEAAREVGERAERSGSCRPNSLRK